ncbi:MAG: hypothetical protein R3F30_16185 [Planctomycetota bacterium]
MTHPGILFLPLADLTKATGLGLPAGVLARRIPDFLCLLLNEGMDEDRVGMLEVREADDQGMPTGEWVQLDEVPETEEVLELLPEGVYEVAVFGSLRHEQGRIRLVLNILKHAEGAVTKRLRVELPEDKLVEGMAELAEALAGVLGVQFRLDPWARLGTTNLRAFGLFLLGLEGAASLDPQLLGSRSAKDLLTPFIRAIDEDPEFRWALRKLHWSVVQGVHDFTIAREEAGQLYDLAYSSYTDDREAAAWIGEFLGALEDGERAEDWLRLAIDDEHPPAEALEFLGILLANRGETMQARNLWLTGVRVDGHPDFFAHLARLAFSDGQLDEAWDKVLRGLRRLSERACHPGEWDEDEGRGGVLLRYLAEHLCDLDARQKPPADVGELLVDLVELIREPEDRVNLGICLARTGFADHARQCLFSALPRVEDLDRRDAGAETLCELMFPGFDDDFAAAVEGLEEDGDPRLIRAFFEGVVETVPQFWPAWFFLGRLDEEEAKWDEGLVAYRTAAFLRRDQGEIWAHVAVCAHKEGELDEAIEAIDKALEQQPQEPSYLADRALLLWLAGRKDEALDTLEAAETLAPEHDGVLRARDLLRDEAERVEE